MQQNIETERLLLRPFRLSDSKRVSELAGEKIIADMTANIPHPYQPIMAESWIKNHRNLFNSKKGMVYALTLKGDDRIMGAVSFPTLEDGLGVLGYWLGVQYWGKGFAFEASKGLVEHCKREHGLETLEVMHLVSNDRSKSVIKKLGVTYLENRVVGDQGREVCVYRSAI